MAMVFGAVLSAAILYLVVASPVYESEASLYIGRIRGVLLEQPTPLVMRLDTSLGKKAREHNHAKVWIDRIGPDRRDGRLIQFTVRGSSAEEAQGLAQKVLDDVRAQHALKLMDIERRLKREAQELREITTAGRGALTIAGREQSARPEQRLSVAAAMMYSSVELGTMQQRLAEIEDMLLGAKTSPTRVVQSPALPRGPMLPKTAWVLAFGVMASFAFAVISALVAEARSKRRVA
jgi:uncharacterized protein involved in exopolysaccharide biosynthesis